MFCQVFCGYEHSFASTSDGDVYAFGKGLKGQLGIGNAGDHTAILWVKSDGLHAHSEYNMRLSQIPLPCTARSHPRKPMVFLTFLFIRTRADVSSAAMPINQPYVPACCCKQRHREL